MARLLRDACLDQFTYESLRQWVAWRKADRPFADIKVSQHFSVRLNGGAQIEGAVFGGRSPADEIFAVQTKSRDPVADTFLCFWRCRTNCSSELPQRSPLVGAQRHDVFCDRFEFCRWFRFGFQIRWEPNVTDLRRRTVARRVRLWPPQLQRRRQQPACRWPAFGAGAGWVSSLFWGISKARWLVRLKCYAIPRILQNTRHGSSARPR